MINSYRIGGWEVNIIMGSEEIRCMSWIHLAQDRDKWWFL
jgi:hypothetical protein